MTDYLKRTTEYRDSVVASVFDELSFWSSRFGHLLFKHLEFRRYTGILDLGFGTGFPLFELAHTFGPTVRVTGLDLWKEAAQRALVKQKLYELPNAHLVLGDGARQPFRDETFDLIVSNIGVNNFTEPLMVLHECFRVARHGARIVLTTNVKGHYREFYEEYGRVLKETGKGHYMERLSANEEHRGTRETVCGLLSEAGFKVGKIVEDEFEMRFLDGSAMLRHSLVRFGFLGGWRGVVATEEEEEVFRALEQRLNDAARKRGELRMTVPMLYVEAEKK